ncbi:Methylsterol monooxygenase 1-1 [Acorus calamus]|uniref:aldehyde oxygenase (deformylating) n=1 Tax=Acorus calamus TaxID=4465 RepID=A0AAV9C7B1_ACOCL|nr:Methylsterol monooxygenase 1-1 [Acorus calamus]
MLPYSTVAEAEAALGRGLTGAETVWFRYSSGMSDFVLYCHNVLFLFLFTVVPLSLALVEVRWPSLIRRYKLQPKVQLTPSAVFRCFTDVMRILLFTIAPLQLASYPIIKLIGIRTGLALPSAWEILSQLVVYVLIEDFSHYWIHRFLHVKWMYENIHRVHHEYTAPIGFVASYAHPVDAMFLGLPSFLGPVLVPCHTVTFWLWNILRRFEGNDVHTGYDFPMSFTKLIPFYGGAEFHDYHHYVGGQSRSNFAPMFTYCDYIYGTDKGYKYQKKHLSKMREQWRSGNGPNGEINHVYYESNKLE